MGELGNAQLQVLELLRDVLVRSQKYFETIFRGSRDLLVEEGHVWEAGYYQYVQDMSEVGRSGSGISESRAGGCRFVLETKKAKDIKYIARLCSQPHSIRVTSQFHIAGTNSERTR